MEEFGAFLLPAYVLSAEINIHQLDQLDAGGGFILIEVVYFAARNLPRRALTSSGVGIGIAQYLILR